MPGAFVKALRDHSREVQKLEGSHAEEFLRLLHELQESLRGRLSGYAADDAQFDAFRLRYVLGETEAGIAVLEQKANRLYSKTEQDSVDLAIDHIGDELSRLSKAFEATPLVVSVDAAKVLADPIQQLLANHFDSSVKRYGLELLNGVRQHMFIGMRAGDSYGTVVRSVAAETGPFGAVGRANAERIVRTETSQAYGAAQHSGIAEAKKEIPSLKKVWLHVTSWNCQICGPLHGTEREIDGTWTIKLGKKTREVAHAPAHPNCGCRVSAMKPDWRDKIKKLGYLEPQHPAESEPGHAAL